MYSKKNLVNDQISFRGLQAEGFRLQALILKKD
jgi:hypothetical protein